jgi:hypothetical protein
MQINEVLTSAYKLKWALLKYKIPTTVIILHLSKTYSQFQQSQPRQWKVCLYKFTKFAYGSPEGEHAYKTKKMSYTNIQDLFYVDDVTRIQSILLTE